MVGLKLLANRLVLADSRDLGFRIGRIEPRRIPLMQRVIQIPIPAMNTTGDLPEGIHSATLEEILAAFGNWNRERGLLFQRLERIYRIAARTGHLARFIVFGSFVTSKSIPNDIDVFMVFDDTFDASACDAEVLLLLDHATADSHFGASAFWLRRPAAFGGEQATIEFW